ncbi:putative phosphinothricin N-acetyltransferase [Acetobacteraceae bacterium AT-5844]|nr:putative phosphinothricin N-acetyltransferase [Acetobacteraceae bacterium AT-5844]
MIYRDATQADLPAMAEIYAHHVLNGTGTFEEVPPTEAELSARLVKVQEAGWAWLVAEDEGEVKGYGYFAALRDRSAYRFAAEDSIYVRDDVRGQGVGKALVAALIERAEAAGFRQMFAVIGDSENVGSIGLHLSLGFKQVGMLKAAGLKFGRWLDVVYMQRALGEGDKTIP